MIRKLFLFLAMLVAPLAYADDISGFWKHAEEPGWIEIRLEEGQGTVLRNDKFPGRVGREILKDLVADGSEERRWNGQVYAEKLGEYKNAEITLAEPDRMAIKVKVGFMSRALEWLRVREVPVAAAH